MSLLKALDVAQQLKAALACEIQRSRELRGLLKAMDSRAVLAQASLREAFNHHARWLSGELARALHDHALSRGLADVTLEEIRQHAPLEGALLKDSFAEIRALAASLAELDAFNHDLSQRALTFVQAYLHACAPRPSAYTRHGHLTPVEARTLSEHV
jgi:hypothetical protein